MAIQDQLAEVAKRVSVVEKKYIDLHTEFTECRRMLKIIYNKNKELVYGKK